MLAIGPIVTLIIMMTRATATITKQLWILRHGQALHNPRAEAAKERGCSHDEFLDWMRQDDALDADLTELGKDQAVRVGSTKDWGDLDLIVASPLSRAIRTAELITPTMTSTRRIAVEEFREINGWLLNAKRRSVDELVQHFPSWDFSELTPADDLWSNDLEDEASCSERGYQGLCWIMRQPESNVLLVAHGGILRFMMQQHPFLNMVDGRVSDHSRPLDGRFGNCEARRYEMSWEQQEGVAEPIVTLKELDS